MPLRIWIDALVTGNAEKIKNYADLYMDFCEAIGGRELSIQVSEIIERTQLQTKIQVAELCINELRIMPSREVWDILYSLNYPSSISEYNIDVIEKYIEQILPHVKLDAIDLQVMVNHSNKQVSGAKVAYTKEYFVDMLIEISIAFKLTLTDNITVLEYCRWVCKYKDYVEQMNKQHAA